MIELISKYCNGEKDEVVERYVDVRIKSFLNRESKRIESLIPAFEDILMNPGQIKARTLNGDWISNDKTIFSFIPAHLKIHLLTDMHTRVFCRFLRMFYFRQFGGNTLTDFLCVFDDVNNSIQIDDKKRRK